MEQKRYIVSLTRYPENFDIVADSKEEAIQKAKDKADFSVWESEVEEILDEPTEDSFECCGGRIPHHAQTCNGE